jgi:hypothetical protein
MGLSRSSGQLLVPCSSQGEKLIDRPDMSKNVIRHMTEILVCLVDEATAVPPAVMDCIVAQFDEFATVRPSNHRQPWN